MCKFNAIDAPNSAGWWWCYPVPECEWYDRHRDGLICHILHDNGMSPADGKYYYDDPRLLVMEVFGTNCIGFTDLKYTGELVGKWYGGLLNHQGRNQKERNQI
jgi:hypothetical protein